MYFDLTNSGLLELTDLGQPAITASPYVGTRKMFNAYPDKKSSKFSNFAVDPVSAISEGVGELSKLGQTWIVNRGASGAAEIKASCGAKPVCIKGIGQCNAKWDAYNKCVREFIERKAKEAQAAGQLSLDTNKTALDIEREKTEQARIKAAAGQKFLGMPMGLGITVAVIGTAAIAFGAWWLIKKYGTPTAMGSAPAGSPAPSGVAPVKGVALAK